MKAKPVVQHPDEMAAHGTRGSIREIENYLAGGHAPKGPQPGDDLYATIERRLAGHAAADAAASHPDHPGRAAERDPEKNIKLGALKNFVLRHGPARCWSCERELQWAPCVGWCGSQWSIDRIDPKRGHTCDNLWIICRECNLSRQEDALPPNRGRVWPEEKEQFVFAVERLLIDALAAEVAHCGHGNTRCAAHRHVRNRPLNTDAVARIMAANKRDLREETCAIINRGVTLAGGLSIAEQACANLGLGPARPAEPEEPEEPEASARDTG